MTDIVGRVKAILLSPKTEWPVIAVEPATVSGLFTKYIMILAAIPAVAGFISMSLIGITIPIIGGTYRVSIMVGLTNAIATYILSLVGIFLVSLIIDALAPTFGGTKNPIQALKAAAYSYTAFWVASIAQLVPFLGSLIMLLGLIYGIYLLYLGLPITMQSPKERALSYTALVIVCGIVIGIVTGMVVASVTGAGAMGAAMMGNNNVNGGEFDPDSPLGQLEDWADRMEQAGQNLEAAQQSGDAEAQQDALGQMFGAVLGGDANVESLPPDEMQSYIPERLAGLPRTEISSERNAMMGIQMSQARAAYSDGSGNSVDLEVMDLGGSMGLMAMAAWANIESEAQTATGYERTYKEDGRTMHEEWDNQSMYGTYSVILNSRFMVQVSGNAPSMDSLKMAAGSVDLNALERL